MTQSKRVSSDPPVPRATDVFTDREEARNMLHLFFNGLLLRPFSESKPIKVFYGASGAGKSALLEISISDFHTQMSDQGGYPLTFAQVDLDSDSITPNYPIYDLYSKKLRDVLRKAGLSLPMFDLYCLAWSAKMGKSTNYERNEIREFLGIHEKTAEVASLLSTLFADLTTLINGGNLVLKAASAFRDYQRSKLYAERFPNLELAEMTSADFEENAHEVLASDLSVFLNMQGERNAHPYAVCIVVDGIDKIRSTVNTRNAQWALQALCDRVATHELQSRCGFVLLSRNKLLWRFLYNRRDDLPEETWDALIEHHPVSSLSSNDARLFLSRVKSWYEARMDDAVCAKIHSILCAHTDAILTAAEEIPTDQTEPVYHPFSLDLAIKQISMQCDSFDVHRHLGRGHKDLQQRFLRYMPDDQRNALQSLALALEFDETLFKILVNQHIIEGIPIQDFHDLVSPDNSHILAIGSSYRLHSKMQEAFLADLQDQQNGHKKAHTTIKILISHYAEQLVLAVQDQAMSAMLDSFTRASNILLAHAQSGLLDIAVFQSTFFALDDSLPDGLLGSTRKSLWIRASKILTERFSENNEYALSARAKVAHWTGETGDAVTAIALFDELFSDYLHVLGPHHQNTLTTLSSFAYWIGMIGDTDKALKLFQDLLAYEQHLLGHDHPNTFTTLNNIAILTGKKGYVNEALAILKKLLLDQQRVLGQDHPNTLTTRINIALSIGESGNKSKALELLEALLTDQQRVLGPYHPHTLKTRYSIIIMVHETGNTSKALKLLEPVYDLLSRSARKAR